MRASAVQFSAIIRVGEWPTVRKQKRGGRRLLSTQETSSAALDYQFSRSALRAIELNSTSGSLVQRGHQKIQPMHFTLTIASKHLTSLVLRT